jgi:hypothetical protein
MKEFVNYFGESISYHKFFTKYDWDAICIQSWMIGNVIQTNLQAEIRGLGENMYLFGELNE